MKLFPYNAELTAQQRNYKYQVCRAQIAAEIAYGHLKARWRHLNDMNIDNTSHVITALLYFTIYVKFIMSTSMIHGYKQKESMFNLVY